jgi:hypothetical protein
MGGWSNSALTAGEAPLSSLLPKATTGYGTTNNASSFGSTLAPGQSNTSRLMSEAATLGGQGSDTVASGTSLLASPLDYWQKLLKPPTRTSLAEQQGPAIASVVGQYSTGKKALANQPRGGGTSATAAELPFQESGAITGLLEQQLQQYTNVLGPEAATAIGGISQMLSSLGLGELDLSSKDLSSLVQADLTKSAQKGNMLASLGKGIGTIAAVALAPVTGGLSLLAIPGIAKA